MGCLNQTCNGYNYCNVAIACCWPSSVMEHVEDPQQDSRKKVKPINLCVTCEIETFLSSYPGFCRGVISSEKPAGRRNATPGLGNLCSILLSYEGMYQNQRLTRFCSFER